VRRFAISLLFCVALADAQTLYRYVDSTGRVIISDQAPKGIPFERVEYDRKTNVIDSGRRTASPHADGTPSAKDKAARRARLRDELRAAVDAAQARLNAARLSLEQGRPPRDDEWQPTVTRPDNEGKPNANGVITGRNGRVVCNKDAANRVICPAVPVPSEAYQSRIDALEKAVKSAEEALREAETSYRRNAPD
jgi:Domain of unknown function (DUF4124)